MCLGGIVSFVPPPEHILCRSCSNPPIAPSSCCGGGCFISPTAKSMASRATEARGGISDGAGWLWRPSSDDSEATEHGYDGRSVMDGCFCCELCAKKYGTFVRTSQKNEGPHQPPTLPLRRNLQIVERNLCFLNMYSL
jgi:hypothetical protein